MCAERFAPAVAGAVVRIERARGDFQQLAGVSAQQHTLKTQPRAFVEHVADIVAGVHDARTANAPRRAHGLFARATERQADDFQSCGGERVQFKRERLVD